MELRDRPLVDFLLLEYLWNRNCGTQLENYSYRRFVESNGFLYHELDMKTLTGRLYSLIEGGMFLLSDEFSHSSLRKVHLNKEELQTYFMHKTSSFNLGREYPSVYIRLSFKGGKTWEEKVQADWNRYYTHLGLGTYNICLESANKKFLSKVLEFYLDNLTLIPGNNIKLTTFKPWFPYRIYWKQFVRGYQYQFKVLKENFPKEAFPECQRLDTWRCKWVRDENQELMLREAEFK